MAKTYEIHYCKVRGSLTYPDKVDKHGKIKKGKVTYFNATFPVKFDGYDYVERKPFSVPTDKSAKVKYIEVEKIKFLSNTCIR